MPIFDTLQRAFAFATTCKPALQLAQSDIRYIPEVSSRGIQKPKSKTDHAPPTNAEVEDT
jgi:hypothetical protein